MSRRNSTFVLVLHRYHCKSLGGWLSTHDNLIIYWHGRLIQSLDFSRFPYQLLARVDLLINHWILSAVAFPNLSSNSSCFTPLSVRKEPLLSFWLLVCYLAASWSEDTGYAKFGPLFKLLVVFKVQFFLGSSQVLRNSILIAPNEFWFW